jgi:regulator of protease activity HflC (stomatin/prohibitin superfamily)
MKNTLQSTAQMMSADDYYAGARSEFAQNFSDQMSDGIYRVDRKEIRVEGTKTAAQTAIAQDGTDQGAFGDNTTTRIVTQKVLNDKGQPIRLEQQFRKLGVVVAEANILNIEPNQQFKDRMVLVQKSQADLSIARQDRLKEEEQKLLVTARGQKEVEEKRQITLRDQIEQTTQAETARQLAVINAEREKQRAEIEKQTAQITFDKAQIEAKTTKELADAEAYAKKAVILANGALEQKLAAYVETQKAWAQAFSVAPVPQLNMAGGSNGVGRGDTQNFMELIGAKAAKDLVLDMNVTK